MSGTEKPKTTIDERRKIGAKGVDLFVKKGRKYCPDLTFHRTSDMYAPFDVEIKRKGLLIAFVEVKHRQDWDSLLFPYPTIRMPYQKVAEAQKTNVPVVYAILSNGGDDVRTYFNIASIGARLKPNRGGGAQWGVSYEVSSEEFGRGWSDFWRIINQLWAA